MFCRTKNGIPSLVIVSLAWAFTNCLSADCKPISTEVIDRRMAQYLKKIGDSAGKFDESIAAVDDDLLEYLKNACKNPELLTAPLTRSRSEQLKAFQAGDKKARFYSWDTWTGGTMHYFYSLVQYRVGNRIMCTVFSPSGKAEDEPDCGQDFSDARAVTTRTGKTLYIVTYSAYYDNMHCSRSVASYAVVNGKMILVKAFKAGSKLLSTIDCNHTGVEYDENSFVKIAKDGQQVLVPIITAAGVTTGRYLIYQFDGENFVFTPKRK